jgi:type 1 glutamine amidotransferase
MKKRVKGLCWMSSALALLLGAVLTAEPGCACADESAISPAEAAVITPVSAAPQKRLKLLYVTQSKGFRHASLHQSEGIMENLGAQHGFDVTLTQMAEKYLTPENLKNFDAIVFYTTGELPLSDAQKAALLNFVKGGRFFMGLHSATDTFYKWPEYGAMIGGWFNKHPWTENIEVTLKTEDKSHPVTRHLPDGWTMKEEIYQIKNFIGRDKTHVLVSLDQTKTDMTRPGVEAKDFPLVWWHDYGKGKVMYNAMGHRPDVWTTEWYQTMIVSAIKWGAGQMK